MFQAHASYVASVFRNVLNHVVVAHVCSKYKMICTVFKLILEQEPCCTDHKIMATEGVCRINFKAYFLKKRFFTYHMHKKLRCVNSHGLCGRLYY